SPHGIARRRFGCCDYSDDIRPGLDPAQTVGDRSQGLSTGLSGDRNLRGPAIAAVGSVIGVGESEISIAMGTVFILNAAALYAFPVVGHALGLTQAQFGTWAGIAIHDISSVVGAGANYGLDALQTATAVKLSRALWIIPVALGAAALFRS